MKRKVITLTHSDVHSLIESIDRYTPVLLSESQAGVGYSPFQLRGIAIAHILHHIANKLTIMQRNGVCGRLPLKSWEAIALYELSTSNICNWSDTTLIQKQITP